MNPVGRDSLRGASRISQAKARARKMHAYGELSPAAYGSKGQATFEVRHRLVQAIITAYEAASGEPPLIALRNGESQSG